jgi:hypothetical protein
LRKEDFSMKKKELLKDGTEVTIKKLTLNGLDRLMEFYSELPQNDRKYFRVDVTKRDVVEQRIKQTRQGNFFRLAQRVGHDHAKGAV